MNNPATQRFSSDNSVGSQLSPWWDVGRGVMDLLFDGLDAPAVPQSLNKITVGFVV